MIRKKKGKWYCTTDSECVNVACSLFIAIDLSTCKLYREFKNDNMYVWNYYFHLLSFNDYVLFCLRTFTTKKYIGDMFIFMRESSVDKKWPPGQSHNVCSAGVEVPKSWSF